MTVNVGDIVRVTAKMTSGATDVQNVYHVKHQGSSSITDQQFLDGVNLELDSAYDEIDALLSSTLDFDTIEAFNVTQGVPIGEEAWNSLTSGGDSTSDVYAKQVAGLVKFGTGVAKSQGRKFIGGLAEAIVDSGGAITTGFDTALAAYAADLLTGFLAGGEDFAFGNWNPTLSRFAEWITAFVGSHTATQRRRNVGVGS